MGLKDIYKRAPISDRETVLTFGKFRGESIADILETEPQYLVWLHDNSDFFELDHILLDEAELLAQNARAVTDFVRESQRDFYEWIQD